MEGIKAADAVCRKLRTGAIPYSPEFARLTACQRRLESYRKLAGIPTPLAELKRLDLNTIRTNAKDAYHRYKTFTGRQAEKARQDWMEGLINEQQRKENEEQYKQNPNGGAQLQGQKETQKTTKSNGRHIKANGASREGKGNVQKNECSTKATPPLNQHGHCPKCKRRMD
jgi:hypothetical protein